MNFKSLLTVFILQLFITTNVLAQANIEPCYINFEGIKGISKSKTNSLPTSSKVTYRALPTNKGTVNISRLNGTRVIYTNNKNMPFINLKVETSLPSAYAADTLNLINYFKYVVSLSKQFSSSEVLKIKKNGFTLYGYITKDIEQPMMFLSSFIFFPKKDTVIYIDIMNVKNDFRSYSNNEQFNEQLKSFLNSYTANIKKCSTKN